MPPFLEADAALAAPWHSLRRAEEANAVRAEPLGQDRRYNRYWRFAAGSEARSGRIFAELQARPRCPWKLMLVANPPSDTLFCTSWCTS